MCTASGRERNFSRTISIFCRFLNFSSMSKFSSRSTGLNSWKCQYNLYSLWRMASVFSNSFSVWKGSLIGFLSSLFCGSGIPLVEVACRVLLAMAVLRLMFVFVLFPVRAVRRLG